MDVDKSVVIVGVEGLGGDGRGHGGYKWQWKF